MTEDIEVVDRPDSTRYEILSNGEVAGHVEYHAMDEHIVLTHAETDPAFEGRGIASALAKGVFDDLRARGVKADPQCPFMARWLAKHPEYSDVVVAGAVPDAEETT